MAPRQDAVQLGSSYSSEIKPNEGEHLLVIPDPQTPKTRERATRGPSPTEPVYEALFGFHVFGLGFITSMAFIFGTGVFCSSWLGGVFLGMGEWIIRKLPLVKHIYSAAKQVSAAVNPANESTASFQECVLIRHPRHGEYAFAFITGSTNFQTETGETQLFSVYVPTNHIYVGDIFLLSKADIIHTNLSVREGLEIVVSVGMALPKNLVALK